MHIIKTRAALCLTAIAIATGCGGDMVGPAGSNPARLSHDLRTAGPAGASTTFYGPQEFDRTKGAPDQYTQTISTRGFTGPFVLTVQNGAADGSSRVTSGHVTLDGVALLGPSDFGKAASSWTLPVTPGRTTTLQVELEGKPGTFVTISLQGVKHARFCPGATGDGFGFQKLQDAVDSVSAGDTIWVCDGVHGVDDALVNKAVTIRAEHPGQATLVQSPTAAGSAAILDVNGIAAGTVAITDLSLQFVTRGIHAFGSYDQLLVTGVSLTGPGAGPAGGIGVEADASSVPTAHVIVDSSNFAQGGIGVLQQQPVDFDTFKSTFDGFDACVVYYSANGAQTSQVRMGRVVGNTFTNCRNTMLIEQIGVDTIRNNQIVMASGGDGIYVRRAGQTTATTSPIVITENVLEGHPPTGDPAAYSSWGIGWAILDEGGVAGITDIAERNQISGAFTGLLLAGSGMGISALEATDNTIANTYSAIVDNSSSTAIVAHRNNIVGYTYPIAAGANRVPIFVPFGPTLAAGSLACNWWGSTSGPENVLPGTLAATFAPFATAPIAGQPSAACTP